MRTAPERSTVHTRLCGDVPRTTRRRSRIQTRAAFTLTELLTVMAVIAVLAALLSPVIAASRENARRAACASNLRQLHHAFALYASDHGDGLPPYQNHQGAGYGEREGGATVPVPERGVELVAALRPYASSDRLWFCPTDAFAGTGSQEGHVWHQCASFGTGAAWIWWLGPLQLSKAGDPLSMDGPRLPGAPSDPARSVLLTDNLWTCDYNGSQSPAPYSHGGRFNYLFFDGHVKSYQRVRDSACPE